MTLSSSEIASAGHCTFLTMEKFIPVEMQTMGVTFWYGAILALGFALWTSYRLARWLLQSAGLLFTPFFLRHLVYPITLGGAARLVYLIILGGAARLVYPITLGGTARPVYPIILGGDARIGSLTRLE